MGTALAVGTPLLQAGPVTPPRPKPPTLNDAPRTIHLPKILTQKRSLRSQRINLRLGRISQIKPAPARPAQPPLGTAHRPAGMVRR